MSAAATVAPTSAIASAVARPIPAPAPVTNTTLSCKIAIPSLPPFLDLAAIHAAGPVAVELNLHSCRAVPLGRQILITRGWLQGFALCILQAKPRREERNAEMAGNGAPTRHGPWEHCVGAGLG